MYLGRAPPGRRCVDLRLRNARILCFLCILLVLPQLLLHLCRRNIMGFSTITKTLSLHNVRILRCILLDLPAAATAPPAMQGK